MIRYINVKTAQGVETIDEFDSADFPDSKAFRAEVRRCLAEYKTIYGSSVWSSSRSTKDWRER